MIASYGPPKRPVVKPYSSHLECKENFTNKLLFNEYCGTIIAHLSTIEQTSQPNPAMIDLQPEIKWFMRPYLVNFIIQIHSSLKLKPQTLFLCWNIIDRYCAKRIAFKQHYQLIGCTALWIASKYEDKKSRVPTVRELALMCSNVYEDSMFREMEIHILSTLQWSISHTTIEDILQLAVKFSDPDGKEKLNQPLQNYKGNSPIVSAILAVSRFLAELSLYDKEFLNFTPSILGSTIFVLSCAILNLNVGVDYLSLLNQDYLSNFNFNNKENFDDDLFFVENLHSEKGGSSQSSFLNGFHGLSTLDDIKQISTLLLNLMQSPSEVLIEKYEPLGVMTVVRKFLSTNNLSIDDLLHLTKLEHLHLSLENDSAYLHSPSNFSSFSSTSSNTSYVTSDSSFSNTTNESISIALPNSKNLIMTSMNNYNSNIELPTP